MQNNVIGIPPPKNPKKISGTKLASVLGLNRFETPFGAWVDMVFSYKHIHHKDTPQRLAGRIIEPKIGEFLKSYGWPIRAPGEAVGVEFPDGAAVDLFPQNPIFGGKWDYIGPGYVVEVKTSHSTGGWTFDNGKLTGVPIQYGLQAALYSYLYGFETAVVVFTILPNDAYPIKTGDGFNTSPAENFMPTPENTFVYTFQIENQFPNFESAYIRPAVRFWNEHVLTGQSPPYDPIKDEKVLDMLRRNKTSIQTN